jgi:hypothetical protein
MIPTRRRNQREPHVVMPLHGDPCVPEDQVETFTLRFMTLLIPILALLIPIIAVTSHYLVKPLTDALAARMKQSAASAGTLGEDRVPQLERQVARLQSTLDRVLEEQEFQRQLRIGQPHE